MSNLEQNARIFLLFSVTVNNIEIDHLLAVAAALVFLGEIRGFVRFKTLRGIIKFKNS